MKRGEMVRKTMHDHATHGDMVNMRSRSTRRRTGQINVAWLVFLGSVVVLIGLIGLLGRGGLNTSDAGKTLVVHCAAGIRGPMEKIRADYEKEYGVKVRLTYGGSGDLLSGLEISKRGDLYLPADDTYLEIARERSLVDETLPLASMRAVLVVAKGNPLGVTSFDELISNTKVRLGQGTDTTAIGKMTREILEKQGRWKELEERTKTRQPTVTGVANQMKVKALDAGIIWNTLVPLYPEFEAVSLPELADVKAHVGVGVLRTAKDPTAALRFARYLAARDRGQIHFREATFEVVDGDVWEEAPKLIFYAGAMLRVAIQETVKEFEQREGVRVTCVYNGCGILVTQMKAKGTPDAYLACEQSFMDQVQDLFLDDTQVSQNELVILVPKGNPHQIHNLADLAKPGLRVGVGHEQKCAMGAITEETLKQVGYYDAVQKNVKVTVPTGDLLVHHLRLGSLDAVIAYISNAKGSEKELQAIRLKDIDCAIATQTYAVGKESKFQQLAARLQDAIESAQSRERFMSAGFDLEIPPR